MGLDNRIFPKYAPYTYTPIKLFSQPKPLRLLKNKQGIAAYTELTNVVFEFYRGGVNGKVLSNGKLSENEQVFR